MPLIVGPLYFPYGQAASFIITAPVVAAGREFVAGAGGPVTADASISKDEAAFAAIGGAVTNVATKAYLVALNATDMQFRRGALLLSDAAGAAYDDVLVLLRTRLEPSALQLDASQLVGVKPFLLTPNGATQHTNLFDTVLGSELAAIGTAATNSVGQFLLALWERFFHKVTQTQTQQTVFKVDDSTPVATSVCSNVGGTQTKGRAT